MSDTTNGVIIGVVIGLIFGFFGGYLYYVFAFERQAKREAELLRISTEAKLDAIFREAEMNLLAEVLINKTLPNE